MLPIAEIIRNKRREKNVTQDELAQALGVTFQSVSRWETGVAYPDIELLPSIALFFGITTDELLGANEEARRAEREKYFEILKTSEDSKLLFEIATKAWAEFPNEYFFALMICKQLVYGNVLPREEALPLFRKLCEKMLNENTDLYYRTRAIQLIFLYEDDDALHENWYKYVSGFQTPSQLMERRYNYRNEIYNVNRQKQRNLLFNLGYSFRCDFRKRQHTDSDDMMTLFDPHSTIDGQKVILNIIDVLRDPAVEVDAWIAHRAFAYLRLSSAYFLTGQKDDGYTALEKSISLYETMFRLPPDLQLSYNSPVLDLWTVSRLTNFDPDDVQDELCLKIRYRETFECIENWFNDVRGEEQFKSYITRIKKYKPDGYDEYLKDYSSKDLPNKVK